MPRRRALAALYLAVALLSPPRAALALDGITVVLSEEGGAYTQLADKLRTALAQGSTVRLPLEVVPLRSLQEAASLRASAHQLLVAVGVNAMQELAQRNLPQPVLNVLVPHAAFEEVTLRGGHLADPHHFSALYLDQPWARQFTLIRQALPGRTRVGILLGPDSAEFAAALRTKAAAAGLVAVIGTASPNEADLLPALNRLLNESDVLLAVPDPAIYNRSTIQGILLTSYRQHVPLFGFSPSYLKAGAIAAVYSEPEQFAQQAAAMIRLLAAGQPLPAPRYPGYFTVGINTQVSHSLGLTLDDEATLHAKLQQSVEDAP